jgi:hypothetical protein
LARPKVFCIGFHKTGTTTMRAALEVLGYRVTGPNGTRDPEIAAKLEAMVDRLATEFDAFQDNPWPLVYRRMDAEWPGSRFILTVRDPDRWLDSIVRHFGKTESPMRRLIYGDAAGCPAGNEALYRERMLRHNREVLDYFRDRPGDLLTLDLAKDGRWEALCAFLGAAVPDEPFPHANAKEVRVLRARYRRWGPLGYLMAKLKAREWERARRAAATEEE